MYGIYTYIWLIFMVNVGKYTIHGSLLVGRNSIATFRGKLLNISISEAHINQVENVTIRELDEITSKILEV